MSLRNRFSLRTSWYGLIVLASLMPAIAMTPWLSQEAHKVFLDREILKEKIFHQEVELTITQKTRHITDVLVVKAEDIENHLNDKNQFDTLSEIARSVMERDNFISTVTVYDRQANIIGSSSQKGHTKAKISKNTSSFASSISGHTFIGSVSELEDGHLELVISIPVFINSEPQAVLAATIHLNQLWESILRDTTKNSIQSYIIDSKGHLLVDLPETSFKQGDDISSNYNIVATLINHKQWDNQLSYKGIRGSEVFGIPSLIPSLGWGIVSEIPADHIMGEIYDAILVIITIVFMFHIFFAIISLLASRFLLLPITEIIDVMNEAKEGHYVKTAEHTRFQEIKTLTSAFNNMIEEIGKRETSLSKLSQAIEQAGESVIITDELGTIEYVNPSFTKITGYSAEEVIGKNPRILKSGNQPDEYYRNMWATITSGEIWRASIVDRRKDGSLYPAIATISPIFNKEGRITHYIGTQQDMTENKQLEEKFRQAQKMEAIGVLVGGIAHDFNNMLAAVTSHLHLAKDIPGNPPEVIQKIDTIEKLTFDASDMVKQLLMFSRKAHVEMKPFGLISFVKEISKVCRAGVPESIQFNVSFYPEELVVKGDATQLQQVIMNLVNNAKDALKETINPEITVGVNIFTADKAFKKKHPEELHTQFAHITVSDNGHGISDSDKEHIFDPFYTTKEVGLGTGLGLSMAYGVIQNHQGIIEVESTLNNNTTFHIYIPIIEIGKRIESVDNVIVPTKGNNELILLVDDNQDVRNTARTVLEKLGYRIIEAIDGYQAIEMFNAHKDEISLIITDVVMPKMGGVPAIEQIRKTAPKMKVVFITGYDAGEIVNTDINSDYTSVVTKPYRVHHLSKVVSDLIKK